MATDLTETEIIDSRRAFAACQDIFPNTVTSDKPVALNVGWVGTDQVDETGFIAVTSLDDTLATKLIGEFVLLQNGSRSIVVYTIGRRDLTVDYALSRRAFLELSGLYVDSIELVGRIVR